MRIRNKNQEMKALIEIMKGSKQPFMKSLAKALNRPRRGMSEVNLNSIEKHSYSNEIIAVPGSVLGIGEITKPVHVAALRFSGKAKEKIINAGGKCLTFQDFLDSPPKNVKILG